MFYSIRVYSSNAITGIMSVVVIIIIAIIIIIVMNILTTIMMIIIDIDIVIRTFILYCTAL